MGGKFNRKDFLDALFFRYCRDVGGFIIVRTSDQHNVKSSTRCFPKPDALAREQFGQDQNVLFGVCPREKMKPGKEHIRHVTAIWAGLDIGPDGYSGKERHFATDRLAIMAVKSFPLQPSAVVLSGRGLHLYWLLKEVTEVSDPEVTENALRRIAEFFQCGSQVGLDSVLRLPETWNPKHMGHPMECRVQHLDTSLRYDFRELEEVDVRMIIPSKRPPKVQQPLPPIALGRVTVVRDSEEPPPSVAEADDLDSPSEAVASIVEALEGRQKTGFPEYVGEPEVEATPGGSGPDMEKLVDRFIETFSDRLLDKLADRIVEKLLERLPIPGANR
jgi:hypothetical protein